MSHPKVTMSYEQSRKALIQGLTGLSSKPPVEKTIQFSNTVAVEKYLNYLDNFDRESQKAKFVVK